MLACYLTWHLRNAWAPLTFTDEHPPQRDNPVAPAQRSAAAHAKASRNHDADGNPLRSFRGLLDHLATLTRNQIRYHGTSTDVPMLAEPTPDQRRAFDLLDTPIPLTPPRSQNTHPPNQQNPSSAQGFTYSAVVRRRAPHPARELRTAPRKNATTSGGAACHRLTRLQSAAGRTASATRRTRRGRPRR